jgi:hypothetical protein
VAGDLELGEDTVEQLELARRAHQVLVHLVIGLVTACNDTFRSDEDHAWCIVCGCVPLR